jgi:LuxR family maltose regulon positive regulatory protein
VLAAPAGSGKSVLLDQWVTSQLRPPIVRVSFRNVGWLAESNLAIAPMFDMVGPGEDEPRVSGWLTALWPAGEASVRLHESPLRDQQHLTELVEELGRLDDAILVLDGWDAVAEQWLRDQVAGWVESRPPTLHFVLAQRNCDPDAFGSPSPSQGLIVISERDLAFTADEVRRFVTDVSGQWLSDEYLELLLTRTEGWPVGVQLAAIGLRDAPDPEDYIVRFSSREDRHVAAYLCGEVLRWEPAAVRRFLIQTSVLSRLAPSVCDAITGDDNGAAMLRRLEQRGLFLRRLPGEGGWFAYHGLFRGLLRRELRVGEPGAEARLLTRAANWHAANDQPEPAARYLMQAERWQDLIELADRYGSSLVEQGQAGTVLSWLRAIPTSADPGNVELGLRRAYLHLLIGESRQAAQIAHELEDHNRTFGQQVAIDALRAICASLDASPDLALSAADTTFAELRAVDPATIPNLLGMTSPTSLSFIAAASQARALFYSGDLAEAREILTAQVRERRARGPWLIHILSALALIEAWSGNLRVARIHALKACSAAGRAGLMSHPAILDARLAAAHVFLERNDLPQAAARLDEAECIARRHPRPMAFARYAIERALWHLASGQPELALAEVDRGRAAGAALVSEAVMNGLRVAEARILLAMGEVDRAEAIIGTSEGFGRSSELKCLAVHAAVARHDLEMARARLDVSPVEAGEPRGQMEEALCRVIVDFEAGDRGRALQQVIDLLRLAEQEGHVRLFLDAGHPVERVLRTLVHANSSRYARYILTSGHRSLGEDAVLGLSKRELEVVRYLPTPLSSTEIAARLYISLNTLKTHLRTIYGKLGVRGRRDAIERVEQLGIA